MSKRPKFFVRKEKIFLFYEYYKINLMNEDLDFGQETVVHKYPFDTNLIFTDIFVIDYERDCVIFGHYKKILKNEEVLFKVLDEIIAKNDVPKLIFCNNELGEYISSIKHKLIKYKNRELLFVTPIQKGNINSNSMFILHLNSNKIKLPKTKKVIN